LARLVLLDRRGETMIRPGPSALFAFVTASMLFAAHAGAEDADPDALGVLTFKPGSPRLNDSQLTRVNEIAAWHAKNPNSLLMIEGYPARGGASSKNLRRTQDRTDAVRDALIMAGADRTRMVLVAHPDAEPGARSPTVRVRGMGDFVGIAVEQREDARAARGASAQRSPAATRGRAAVAAPAEPGAGGPEDPRGGTTVVIVPPGAGPRAAANQDGSAEVPGPEPTSGGNGTSAQTGIGYDPTDYATPGDFGAPARPAR
jgi:hypothetical protein